MSVARSSFVTVVAWIFIIFSGFGTLITILQNIMYWTLFRSPEVIDALQRPMPGAPPLATFLASHMHWFFIFTLMAALAMLVCSIGLLRRLNWARLGFIGLMVLAAIWNLGGLVLQWSMFSSVQQDFAQSPGMGEMSTEPVFMVIVVMSALMAVGFSLLFGWIARRLASPAIAAEFH
ncbi:MAG TPA: hypothetical protein VFN29_05560 [Chiayiivirga sp.]|nr:hypothetical protein [Chiayiivirga sp.]